MINKKLREEKEKHEGGVIDEAAELTGRQTGPPRRGGGAQALRRGETVGQEGAPCYLSVSREPRTRGRLNAEVTLRILFLSSFPFLAAPPPSLKIKRMSTKCLL